MNGIRSIRKMAGCFTAKSHSTLAVFALCGAGLALAASTVTMLMQCKLLPYPQKKCGCGKGISPDGAQTLANQTGETFVGAADICHAGETDGTCGCAPLTPPDDLPRT